MNQVQVKPIERIFLSRMKRALPWLAVAFMLACFVSAQGQVLATQRAGFGLPANQVPAPNTPGGGVVVGNNFYATDQVNGFRHYLPSDPTNPDPVNTGILTFDNIQNDGMSLGGAAVCIPFCKTGQVAYDGNQTVWVNRLRSAERPARVGDFSRRAPDLDRSSRRVRVVDGPGGTE